MSAGVELVQVALGQAMKTQQQVVEILLQIGFGAGHQGIEVLRLVVERLQDGEAQVQACLLYTSRCV